MRIFVLIIIIFIQYHYFASVSEEPSIIIIGAGAAGIASATRLLKNGFKNLIILEAESRIGGRIHSVLFGDVFIDLGARWCHGEKGNIVYETVKNLNLLRRTEYRRKFFLSSKKPIDDEFANELHEIMDELYLTDGNYPPEYKSLGDYCEKQYNITIHERFNADNEKLDIAKDALDFFHLDVVSNEGSPTWFESTAQSDYVECEGFLELNWKGKGFKIFLDVLMKMYPDPAKQLPVNDKLILNKHVVGISWNSSASRNGIVVNCSDRSTFTADHVIFTPSIGVLKETSDFMFTPRLPRKKMEAIKNIGFGPVLKIAMLFDQKWWNNYSQGFNFIWTETDKKRALLEFSKEPSYKGRSWITYNHYMLEAEHNPKVLIAWFSGRLVSEIELLPEETLLNGLHYILKKFLGHIYNVTKPGRILHTNWYSNPHFRGSYSYQTSKAKKGNRTSSAEEDLAEPIKNIDGRPFLHFAGEGTHSHYYSNVHGAVDSGYREADIIINYHK